MVHKSRIVDLANRSLETEVENSSLGLLKDITVVQHEQAGNVEIMYI